VVTNRWVLFSLAFADGVSYLVTNLTVRSRSHPGTVSNVFAYAPLIGLLLLLVLTVVAPIRWMRLAWAARAG
jgi:hypothetical protein